VIERFKSTFYVQKVNLKKKYLFNKKIKSIFKIKKSKNDNNKKKKNVFGKNLKIKLLPKSYSLFKNSISQT
jgi:hypothetical protein